MKVSSKEVASFLYHLKSQVSPLPCSSPPGPALPSISPPISMGDNVVDLTGSTSESPSRPSKRARASACPCQPFYLLAAEPPSSLDNSRCLSMREVISAEESHPIEEVVLFNFLVDMNWLLEEVPSVTATPCTIFHGSRQDIAAPSLLEAFPRLIIAKVQVSIPYGTHHSKLGFIFYTHGVRVFIGTNNLIPVDNIYKTQGIYVQDFPLKASVTIPSEFEQDLVDYLQEIKVDLSCSSLKQANLRLQDLITRIKQYDFNDAEVMIVASVPGYHSGTNLNKWGHMRLRTILEKHPLPEYFTPDCPLVIQVSSIGES